MPEETLAEELTALGRALDLPPAPDPVRTAAVVRRRVNARHPGHRRLRLAAAAAAVVAVGFAVLLVSSAQVRAAVAELLRFGGVVVEQGVGPTSPASPGGAVDGVDAARALVDFPVLVPAGQPEPQRVEVLDGRVVSLSYQDFRLDQFDGTLDPAFAKGVPGPVEWTTVGGTDALWLRGPHSVVYLDRDGTRRTETSRLAANTLVWQRGQVTVRLEGAFTLDEARAIAESLR